VIAHYLVGQSPSPDLIARYVKANQALLNDKRPATDRALVSFALRNPWALPYLDAASAILRRDSLLRQKTLVMIAILEATPEYVSYFFPQPMSAPSFFLRMAGYGVSSLFKLVVGCVLYPFATKIKYG
jgi:hypothetical protein